MHAPTKAIEGSADASATTSRKFIEVSNSVDDPDILVEKYKILDVTHWKNMNYVQLEATQRSVKVIIGPGISTKLKCLNIAYDVLHTSGNQVASHYEFLLSALILQLGFNLVEYTSSLPKMLIIKRPTPPENVYWFAKKFSNVSKTNVRNFDPGGGKFDVNCMSLSDNLVGFRKAGIKALSEFLDVRDLFMKERLFTLTQGLEMVMVKSHVHPQADLVASKNAELSALYCLNLTHISLELQEEQCCPNSVVMIEHKNPEFSWKVHADCKATDGSMERLLYQQQTTSSAGQNFEDFMLYDTFALLVVLVAKKVAIAWFWHVTILIFDPGKNYYNQMCFPNLHLWGQKCFERGATVTNGIRSNGEKPECSILFKDDVSGGKLYQALLYMNLIQIIMPALHWNPIISVPLLLLWSKNAHPRNLYSIVVKNGNIEEGSCCWSFRKEYPRITNANMAARP